MNRALPTLIAHDAGEKKQHHAFRTDTHGRIIERDVIVSATRVRSSALYTPLWLPDNAPTNQDQGGSTVFGHGAKCSHNRLNNVLLSHNFATPLKKSMGLAILKFKMWSKLVLLIYTNAILKAKIRFLISSDIFTHNLD